MFNGRYLPSSVTAFDMPLVPLILLHGIVLIEVLRKRYPGNSGVMISTNFPFFFEVFLISGRKTSKPWRFKCSFAVKWAFGFVWRRYQFKRKPFYYLVCVQL